MLRALRQSRDQSVMAANQPVKLGMLKLLPTLLLLSFGVSNGCCSTIADNSTDMLSLVDFKRVLTPVRGASLSSWNSSIPHCQWEGVNCSRKHPGRVTVLSLSGLGLAGPISPSIGNLTFLVKLDLSMNRLTGQLPPLAGFHRLQQLLLANNSLQGIIPDTITNCSNLKWLDLSGNSLTGDIPLDIGLLPNLSVLLLPANRLTGIIPPSLKNTSKLEILDLAQNKLTGSIPDDLCKSQNLLSFVPLGANSLSGTVPGTLFNCSSLQFLDLGTNMLANALPSEIILPSLEHIILDYNSFEGHVPASLGNISGLQTIDLSFNNFSGQVPSSLGNLGTLTFLSLQGNKLEAKDRQSWKFVDIFSNHSSLQVLILSQNQFEGAIPNSIGKLSATLQQLGLGTNNFSGMVPTSIGNLTGLYKLELSNNNLNGSIERWIGNLSKLQALALESNNFIGLIPSSVGDFKNLTLLNLSENMFEGTIPSSMGNLSQLALFSLAKNKLEGPIPPSLGNLPMLDILDLSYNNLHGVIPKEVFHIESTMTKCILSHNNLEGTLPLEISNLQQLTELYVSSNNLTGGIPNTLGNCEGLQIIEMDHNLFDGNISTTLNDLKSLTLLNLSHNNLSGFIPVELGDLQDLTKLDLSYNDLQGEVPKNGVFANAKSVSLIGNQGLCGGVQDLHIRPCPMASRRKQTEYYLIRVLIPVFGFMSLILLIYFLITERKTSRPKSSGFPSIEEKLKVSYNDLAEATHNFSESNLVGRGGYGSVYRGKLLKRKSEVAVKVLDLDMHGAEKSFLSECEALRNIQHRNLVPIITACSTVDTEGKLFKALIYEFMPNENLDLWLHHKGDGKAAKRLDLTQRINVIVNIADALDYLHNDIGSRSVIHCDVKPSNILLDDDMIAHLGDFGIASFYKGSGSAPITDSNTSSFGVKGTIGYIAPEYAGGGHASTCGDVYSFGIVILEILTGKRPTDPMFENGLNIVSLVEGNFPDQILQLIDAGLQDESKPFSSNSITEREVNQCLCSLLEVALSCTRQYPSERMNMRQAAAKVHEIQASYVRGRPKTVSSK